MSPSSPALRRRARERRGAAEQAILDATEALLVDHDFRDLTVEEVMASTGLSRTTFYRYFPDLDAVLLRRFGQIGGELGQAADSWLQDPRTGLEAGFEFVTMVKDHARLLLAFDQAAGTGTEIGETWRAFVRDITDRCAEFVVRLREEGSCDIAEPHETARALVAMTIRYLLETFRPGATTDVQLAAATLADVWQRTLFSLGIAKPSVPD